MWAWLKAWYTKRIIRRQLAQECTKYIVELLEPLKSNTEKHIEV